MKNHLFLIILLTLLFFPNAMDGQVSTISFGFEDHELRSLQELETYISLNKHLPNIPGESEVRDKGVNLGEMNAKLLQKIEELTLYMIDINKRMNSLETENSELKKRLRNSD